MRFTQKLERQVLNALRINPKACITFPDDAYREDGSITIIRDGLTYRLHRYLAWKATGQKIPDRLYLIPNCKTTGCMNPMHRELTNRPGRGRTRLTCPNGHLYAGNELPEGSRDRCRTCKEERLARRRKGTRQSGYCKNGHKLTEKNSYRWTDARGRKHRRCRTCTIAATRARRATNTEGSTHARTHPDPQEDRQEIPVSVGRSRAVA